MSDKNRSGFPKMSHLPTNVTISEEHGSEIVFEVSEALEGGYDARALGYGVFTQGEDWDDLREMVEDAVRCHFADDEVPGVIQLRFVRDEATP